MKIGIVLSQPPSYSETFFNSKIKGLKAVGYDVQLFVQNNKKGYENCSVVVAPKVYKNRLLQTTKTGVIVLQLLPYLRRVRRFIRLENAENRSTLQILKNIYTNAHLLKADLDWVHFGFTTLALQSENVAETINAKMAVSCRGYDMDVYPLKNPNCYSRVWEKVDNVHAISHYMLAKAVENGMPESKPNAIIAPAIDAVLFKDYSKHRTMGSVPKITTVARLHWIKGLEATLKALAILKSKDIRFHYQIIGSGSEYESLSFAIYQLGLKDCVTLVGDLSHTAVLEILAETDVYMQYSLSEGFCNAVLEAQAMGCLCVVSDGGALPENILQGKTGWVVPKNKPNMLAETLQYVLSLDENKKEQIRTNARKRVLKDFALGNQIQQFISFYATP